MKRRYYLDGIRGIACIMVVLSHIAQLYYPYLIQGDEQKIHSGYEKIFTVFPFTLFYNGNAAVHVFFVIGGFLAISCAMNTDTIQLFFKKCLKRYLRLMIPIAITMIFVGVIINTGGLVYSSLDAYTYNNSIIPPTDQVSISGWLKYVMFTVFVDSREFQQPILSYNHVLWTIQIEFISSIVIYCLCFLIKKRVVRVCILLGIVVGTFLNNQLTYCTYFMGALLAELYYAGLKINNRKMIGLSFAASLIMLGWPYILKDRMYLALLEVCRGIAGKVNIFSLMHWGGNSTAYRRFVFG